MLSVEASTNQGVLLTRCSIEFAPAIQRVPNEVLDETRRKLEEMAEGLKAVPPASVFWRSMRQSRLCIEVDGWYFYYDLEPGVVRVTACTK